jgi:hypothetical protein
MAAAAPTARARPIGAPGSGRCARSFVAWRATRGYDGASHRTSIHWGCALASAQSTGAISLARLALVLKPGAKKSSPTSTSLGGTTQLCFVPSEARTLSAQDPNAVKAVRGRVQLALRVSATSVTVITPGAGCSITSTATVSTTGVTGCFTFRAAFFAGAGLGLALATVGFVAFAALAALRALPRLAELRSFARFCTFDAFLTVQVAAR